MSVKPGSSVSLKSSVLFVVCAAALCVQAAGCSSSPVTPTDAPLAGGMGPSVALNELSGQASEVVSPEGAAGTVHPSGSGSNDVIANSQRFSLFWGSSEQNKTLALVNYIQARVSIPLLGINQRICSTASIYSLGSRRFMSPEKCQIFVTNGEKSWYLYQPPAASRVQVRRGRGSNELRIDYIWQCLSLQCLLWPPNVSGYKTLSTYVP